MAGVSEHSIKDERLVAATGETREHWHALLDAEAATGWKHPEIARWLVETHGVDGWWAQSITVGYEQARGMRLPGQQSDGTFSVTVSKTLPAPRDVVFAEVLDRLTGLHGDPSSVNPESKYATARWRVDEEVVLVRLSESKGRAQLTLERSKIRDGATLASAKQELREVAEAVAGRVG